MKRIILILAAICCAIFALTTSCRKRAVDTTCTSKLHGFTAPDSIPQSYYPFQCNHVIIGPSGGIITTSGSFMSVLVFNHRGAYNTTDNCYYTIAQSFVPPYFKNILNKTDAFGAVSTLVPVDSMGCGSVFYNRVNNKLYGGLSELTVGATSYSVTPVATSSHIPTSDITVDVTTGDMYLKTVDTSVFSYYLEKYHPGASSTTMVAPIPEIYEIKFNKNDHMLYALQPTWGGLRAGFVRINPATGAISTLSTGLVFNGDFHSGTLDPCTNRYIYSTNNITTMSGDMFMLYQLDMSGVIVQQDTTATMYQGLDVEY